MQKIISCAVSLVCMFNAVHVQGMDHRRSKNKKMEKKNTYDYTFSHGDSQEMKVDVNLSQKVEQMEIDDKSYALEKKDEPFLISNEKIEIQPRKKQKNSSSGYFRSAKEELEEFKKLTFDDVPYVSPEGIRELRRWIGSQNYDNTLKNELWKIKFAEQSFEFKKAVFSATNPVLRDDTKLKGLIDYVAFFNKEEGEFLQKSLELDNLRWNERLTAKEKVRRKIGSLIRESIEKDNHQDVKKLCEVLRAVENGDKNALNQALTVFEVPMDYEDNPAPLLEDLLLRFIGVYPNKKGSEFEFLWKPGFNVLMLAVQLGSNKHAEEFVKTIDVNAQDGEGKTALMYCNDIYTAQILIDSGAKGDITDIFGTTALFHIRDLPTIQRLVTNKLVDVHHRDKDGRNVLFFCRDKNTMEFYIKSGVDVNVADQYGQTPLFAHGCRNDLIQLLLDKGAIVNHKDKNGRTALFESRDSNAVVTLLKFGVDQSPRDGFGRTWVEYMKHVSPYSPLAKDICDTSEMLIEEGTQLR